MIDPDDKGTWPEKKDFLGWVFHVDGRFCKSRIWIHEESISFPDIPEWPRELFCAYPCTPEGWIAAGDGLPEVKRGSDGDGVGNPAMSQIVLWLRKDGIRLIGALETFIENKVAIGFVPDLNGCKIPGFISIRDKPLVHGGISCSLSAFTHWQPLPPPPKG